MRKTIILAVILLLAVSGAFAQTTILNFVKGSSPVKEYMVTSGKIGLGRAYTIENQKTATIAFYPTAKDVTGAKLIVTGTYTNANDSVCGKANNADGDNVGVEDPNFAPNAMLSIDSNGISWEDVSNAISVYKLIAENEIDTTVGGNMWKVTRNWRYMVAKNWVKTFADSNKANENGTDWIIVHFDKPMTLAQACNYITGIAVKDLKGGKDWTYTSTVDACLLSTQYLCFDGNVIASRAKVKESNLIIVR